MISLPRRSLPLLVLGLLLTACSGLGGAVPTASTPTATAATAGTARGAPSPTPTSATLSPAPPGAPTATATLGTRTPTPAPQAAPPGTVIAAPPHTPTMPVGAASPSLTPTRPGTLLIPLPTVGADTLARLRRPLQLPTRAPGDPCPTAEGRRVNPAFSDAHGAGPVYAVGLGVEGVLRYAAPQDGGPWFIQKVLFVVSPDYRGPVLLRGRQLDGPDEVRFEQGADPAAELLLPDVSGLLGNRPPTPPSGASAAADWGTFPSSVRVRGPGCYAWQADGLDFSAVIVFEAVYCCPPQVSRERAKALASDEWGHRAGTGVVYLVARAGGGPARDRPSSLSRRSAWLAPAAPLLKADRAGHRPGAYPTPGAAG